MANSAIQRLPIDEAKLNEKPEKVGCLEVAWFQASRHGVVDGERRGDERPPSAVRGQRAERIGVGKDQRDVAKVANIGVGGDGVEVVEMEPVVEVVAIGERHEREDGEQWQYDFLARNVHGNRSQETWLARGRWAKTKKR